MKVEAVVQRVQVVDDELDLAAKRGRQRAEKVCIAVSCGNDTSR